MRVINLDDDVQGILLLLSLFVLVSSALTLSPAGQPVSERTKRKLANLMNSSSGSINLATATASVQNKIFRLSSTGCHLTDARQTIFE